MQEFKSHEISDLFDFKDMESKFPDCYWEVFWRMKFMFLEIYLLIII